MSSNFNIWYMLRSAFIDYFYLDYGSCVFTFLYAWWYCVLYRYCGLYIERCEAFFFLHLWRDWFGSSNQLNHWWIILDLWQLGFKLCEPLLLSRGTCGFSVESSRVLSRLPPTRKLLLSLFNSLLFLLLLLAGFLGSIICIHAFLES